MTPAKTQPALLGGLVIGVLSALPMIKYANCCCAWILFGGALASYLMQQNHADPIELGDGAIVGLLAGVVGTFIWLPLSLLLSRFEADFAQRVLRSMRDIPPELQAMIDNASAGSVSGVGVVFFFFVMLFVTSFFGMIGGLFGALLFRKNTPPPPPPPPVPPSFMAPSFPPSDFPTPPIPGSERR